MPSSNYRTASTWCNWKNSSDSLNFLTAQIIGLKSYPNNSNKIHAPLERSIERWAWYFKICNAVRVPLATSAISFDNSMDHHDVHRTSKNRFSLHVNISIVIPWLYRFLNRFQRNFDLPWETFWFKGTVNCFYAFASYFTKLKAFSPINVFD